jgi:broad specificity phosphatase PhoE
MKRLVLLLLVLLLALSAVAAEAPKVTTVILVRHAEKAATPGSDPALSEAGAARAQELARVLAASGVTAIYTTQFARTQQTAAPLAAALKVEPVVLTAGGPYAADLAQRIRATHAGATVLVVGHSNTTIEVMKALGATNLPSIPESQFDDLFICTFVDGAPAKVVALRYGNVTR